ncbi:NAD(P)-dependent oxidoreductase [Tistrella sp. BH-R2-4]|uniref:NAD(P)-dependent oxidoreductase n=1 Tax=Tistrella arctica TaxID=3133430 RepID=A0ABU9YFI2_9PROT
MDVGFVGLGLMGRAMARNIVAAGHHVRAWNRSPVMASAREGVVMVPEASGAFEADVVFTMLADDAAIRAVLLDEPVLELARPGAVHVVTSTLSLDMIEELRAHHEAVGLRFVAAPVFGRPDVAEAGQLAIMAAGDPAAIAIVAPLFDVIGRQSWVMGDDPRQAGIAKIAGNMMIAMAIEAMAEAAALTAAHGLDPAVFLDLMRQTQFGGSRAYQGYGDKITREAFDPGFRMDLGLKDLRLATAAAEAVGARLPQLAAVHGQMSGAVAAGMGDRDWSAVAAYTRKPG